MLPWKRGCESLLLCQRSFQLGVWCVRDIYNGFARVKVVSLLEFFSFADVKSTLLGSNPAERALVATLWAVGTWLTFFSTNTRVVHAVKIYNLKGNRNATIKRLCEI
jgi:hypothetical protein